MNYFIADTHFGHINSIAFDNRPFTDIEKHDEVLIDNWNNAVGMDDDVYILGDFSFRNSTESAIILRKLNGNKHLVRGNHDMKILKNRNIQSLFVEITDYKELDIGNGECVVLCHYPIPCFKNHYYKWLHFYGHVHAGFEWNMMENIKRQMSDLYNFPCLMWNVGVMIPYMGYTPRTLEEIIANGDERDGKENEAAGSEQDGKISREQ